MSTICFEGENIPKNLLPVPAGWRVLVGMLKIEEKTSGGIILTDDHIKGQGHLRFIGKVLAVGALSYQDPKYQAGVSIENRRPEPWAKVGDVVVVGQYSGAPIVCYDENGAPNTLKVFNDDEIIATVPDVSVIKI